MNDSQRRELTNDVFHRSTGSFELVLSPVILGFLGFLLDRAIGTLPIFTIAFAVLGIVGAAARVYYGYRYAMQQLAESTAAHREAEARLAAARLAEAPLAEATR